MITALLGYKLASKDYDASLDRLGQSATVKKDAAYYAAKIGTVKTVDAFLADYRLSSYALKAYGLSDYTNSQGFIRKVLESDLTDSTSFANKLADNRFRQFAAKFQFAQKTAEVELQGASQQAAMAEAYSEHRVRMATAAAAKTSHYETKVATTMTVDDFLADPVLRDVALKSIGVTDEISTDFLRKALTRTLVDDPSTSGDDKYIRLGQTFNFDTDGSLLPGETKAQGDVAAERMLYDYDIAIGNTSSSVFAARNDAYVAGIVAGATSVDDIAGNPRVFDYLMAATGLDPTPTVDYLKLVLKDDADDSAGLIKTLPEGSALEISRKRAFTLINSWFNIDNTGAVTAPPDSTQLESLSDAYFANYKNADTKRDTSLASRFSFVTTGADTVSDLLARNDAFGDDALEYALAAFDIDLSETSKTELRKVLTSDISDPKSYVRKMGDDRFLSFAGAFNFGADGKLAEQRTIQSVTQRTTLGSLYKASFGADVSEAKAAVIKGETKDYLERVGKILTFDQLMGDRKVLDYALTAHGLEPKDYTIAELRKILTSDLSDRKSFAYGFDNTAVIDFVTSFNVEPDGTIAAQKSGGQSGVNIAATQRLYLSATLEEQSAETNEGSRLALYFLRKAPGITSSVSILADKALLEVVKTALGLPDGFSSLDIDKQTRILDDKLKIEDFKNPKALDKFITRFAALYDIANTSGASSPILSLFGGGSGDMLSAIYL
ncbi:DUF1217 domain-containing protein [Aurantimonas sp. Leaf443]|uniref:DUF1217 domain-containing protein n=1 Tax=Aurantimonas sp. Leaf443 TaxID=1736378 RepID=UPI0006FCE18F|nr:DUF1217 domain-containing protein [Aurantimonas sp. Leaf443]KQT82458.1 hypothetical protein ASG48_15400 [Aurantimonas sp. Leaf443]